MDLNPIGWCAYKKREFGHREMHRRKTMWRHREDASCKPRHAWSSQKLGRLSTQPSGLTNQPWSLTSSFQNCEAIHVCCWSHPGRDPLLRRPIKTDRALNTSDLQASCLADFIFPASQDLQSNFLFHSCRDSISCFALNGSYIPKHPISHQLL